MDDALSKGGYMQVDDTQLYARLFKQQQSADQHGMLHTAKFLNTLSDKFAEFEQPPSEIIRVPVLLNGLHPMLRQHVSVPTEKGVVPSTPLAAASVAVPPHPAASSSSRTAMSGWRNYTELIQTVIRKSQALEATIAVSILAERKLKQQQQQQGCFPNKRPRFANSTLLLPLPRSPPQARSAHSTL